MTAVREESAGARGPRRLSPWRLAVASQTVELAFTSAGHQQLGWHWVWTRIAPPREFGPPVPSEGEENASTASDDPTRSHPILLAGAVQTHPVLAGLAWGPALASLVLAPGSAENGGASGPVQDATGVVDEAPLPAATAAACTRAVAVLAPIVASVGDRIFHFAVPLCLSAGLVVLGLHFSPWSVFWYPILCAFFILAAAVWSWRVGIQGEEAVADLLATRKLERYAQALEAAGRFLLGGVFGWLLASVRSEEGRGALLVSVLLLGAAGTLAWRSGLSPKVRLGLLLLLGAVVSRWIG